MGERGRVHNIEGETERDGKRVCMCVHVRVRERVQYICDPMRPS